MAELEKRGLCNAEWILMRIIWKCGNEERRRVDMSRSWTIMAVALVGLIVVPNLRAAPKPQQSDLIATVPADNAMADNAVEGTQVADNESKDPEANFVLSIVGPFGEPVPKAEIRWTIRPGVNAEAVKQGTFLRGSQTRFYVQSDETGTIGIDLPERISSLDFDIKVPGYGPYWGKWRPAQTGEKIPGEFVATLESAWTVGGIVVDEQGKPVGGVEVDPSVSYRKRPGDESSLGVGTRIFTDDQGRWQFEMVPDSKSSVSVEVSHKEFKPHRMALARDVFSLRPGEMPREKMILPRGLTIRGTVTDTDGKPIVGALLRTKFFNDERAATTDDSGRYEIHGCEDRNARVVVSAKGYATDMAAVRVHESMDSIDFEMKPGGHVKIRVVDADGKGLPRARIFFQGWRGGRFEYFEFDHVNQYADENGVWEWNEAPLDEFQADICNPKGMQLSRQKIIARPEEYVFQPPGFLVVSGLVTDAETKERLSEFRVVPGIQGSEGSHIDWVTDDSFLGRNGDYRLHHIDEECFAHYVRIDAEGYQPQISRPIKSDEGNVKLFFKMQRGVNASALVADPSGRPVEGASVVLGVPGTQMSFQNGRVNNSSTYNAMQRTTDAGGRFVFPPQVTPYEIVIVSDAGYSHIKGKPGETLNPIQLTAWARLKGTYRIGSEPAVNTSIYVSNQTISSYGDQTPNIFMHFDATTGSDGTFLLDRVPEGRTWIQREIVRMVGDGATQVTSTPIRQVSLEPGKTTEVLLGGSGAVVKGRLAPPADLAKSVDWKHGNVDAEVFLPAVEPPPIPKNLDDSDEQAKWIQQWKETQPGKRWLEQVTERERKRDQSVRFNATVDAEGRFRIDDVPPGNYQLDASAKLESPSGQTLHRTDDRFEVVDTKEVDLGEIPIE